MANDRIVGVSVPRKEGRDKVTGQAQYIDDMTLPHMLYGATVRSQIPRGKIKKIAFGPGIAWDEFVVVTAKDIPGKNVIALIADDQPCLADGAVNHPEEPILLLAHPNRHLLPQAVAAGVNATPTMRINGQVIVGLRSVTELGALIETAAAAATGG